MKINRKCDIAKIADGLRQKTIKENLQSPETWARPMFHLDVDEKVMIRRSHSQNHFFPSDNINNSFLNNFYQNGKKLNDRENLVSIYFINKFFIILKAFFHFTYVKLGY